MKNDLIVFTHNDLDALGCMLNIESFLPDINKVYYHTNYADIGEVVKDIITYIIANDSKHIIIADVSFSDNKPHLIALRDTGINITYIDHHLYPADFWDDFPNMTICHNTKKCAALLCNEFFKISGKNPTLDRLTHIIDVYDIWQTKAPEFNISQDINRYFWYCAREIDMPLKDIMKSFIASGWKLPPDYKKVIIELNKTVENKIKDYHKRGCVAKIGDITLCLVQDTFNEIVIQEMNAGQNCVVGLNPFGIVRIRFNENAKIADNVKNALRLKLAGTENIGHMNAFTYKMPGVINFDKIVDYAEFVINTITAHKNEEKACL